MSLEDTAEELASALGADKAEVKRDLENLVQYSVPLEEAKQSVRRKYGGGGGGAPTPETVSIADIGTDSSNVTVTAKVLTVGKRSIRYQNEDHLIHEGELADETGKISYTDWHDFGLEAGDTVTVTNAGVREWEGNPELNLGDSSSVDPAKAIEVPFSVGGDKPLTDLKPGDRGVNVDAVVSEVEEKTISGRDGETTILSGVLADDSGRLPFTDWNPHGELEAGASVRITGAYVREFRGIPSVNISEFSAVEALDTDLEVSDDAPRKRIDEAVGMGGLFDVEIVGNLLSVRDGSGLIQRCPECNRVTQKGQCRSHGQVDGYDDLRVKAILDDGTGALTVILDRDLTEQVYGGSLEDALDAAREAMDQEVVADAIRENVVGGEFVVRGSLSVDDYGANLDATSFRKSDDDPAARATAVLSGVDA
ncbi:Single-stranded DNA binding protein [Haladaptatus sp. CMSO5]|uniref:Single-stranded DNA binding protein n=1 Tax=Haladaptatus sp. CMSO5 TaxID=3120514 RepID=UPI002FCE02F2